ncbi:MAG: adenine nucleotide alpha hydrolase [Chloroflexota bacterium]|nr:adenine nucleotide alpha hydrolase [Chloroflexota bacterium]
MEHLQRCAVSFSGGKDSFLALDRALQQGLAVDTLVTMYDEASQRVRFHGVPIALIQEQANALGLMLLSYPTAPDTFEAVFLQSLHDLRQRGITTLIFGNIHLADVRAWYEERTTAAGLIHVEPLWGQPPARLVREFLARGYAAILTCIEEARANPTWLGAPLTEDLIQACEQAGIDPCGEYGEYHTFVYAGPLFSSPLAFDLGERISQAGFQLIDIQPQPGMHREGRDG